ncbi:response regulator transcription factor [Phytohabitans sp. ZYX-F-186]|uniref:Response regulator transcription factor n=1 Tax=Phytohabitans maris TaxID=3071409 RepID=A0ABU0ZAV7_9ACTN|nr:response regulator transcription factor [Phytohabitans sp. ZYX-F-186]MDQ7904165.1 response regulator transcription factor [Phytohabitans sp. ZYX-F-186]
MIRVLVAEDQNLIRGALVALLSLEPDITVVAETARGDTILAEIEHSRPNVAVVDIDLPGMDGIVAAQRLKDAGSPVRILVLTSVGTPGNFDRAMQAGVAGFLVKDAPSDRLSRAIRDVHAGRRVIDVELADAAGGPAPVAAARVSAGPLSSRERGILAALREGASLPSLRSVFGLSSATLQAHLAAAQSKTGSRSSADAARVAYENGWL